MKLTNYVATKDLFQALIRAKRGVRKPAAVEEPVVEAPRKTSSPPPPTSPA